VTYECSYFEDYFIVLKITIVVSYIKDEGRTIEQKLEGQGAMNNWQ
jgi:hypothetical protein